MNMNMENFDDVIFEDDEFGDIDLGQQKPEVMKVISLQASKSLLHSQMKI